MLKLFRAYPTESWLALVLVALVLVLALSTPQFFTLVNLADILNASSIDIIFAVGLLAVLIAGGIDISFAVAASVAQYLAVSLLIAIGGGNWALGLLFAAAIGIGLGAINAALIYYFRIISIVVTIATFNIFFGLLMFFTRGVSIYNLPPWLGRRIVLVEHETPSGAWAELTLPVVAMVVCVLASWIFIRHSSIGRQLYAYGDNAESARRIGIDPAMIHFVAYGWLGLMAGIAGLMQVNYAQEVVPNALFGRELDVLAAVVLGGARLGGGRGSVTGCVLGVLLIAVTQNGLNLLGVSPYAFRMVTGGIILFAITVSNLSFEGSSHGPGRRRS